MKFKSLIVAAILTVFSAVTFAADCPKKNKFGWEAYDPFQMKIGNDVTGFDIDLFKAIMDKMKCPYEMQDTPWNRALIEMKESGATTFAGSATKTKEREEFAYFSVPYVKTNNIIITKKGDSAGIKITNIKDFIGMKDIKISVIRGYEYGGGFEELKKDAKFAALTDEASNEEQALKKILSGRTKVGFFNEFVVLAKAKEMKVLDQIEVHPVLVSSDDSHYMMSKKSVTEDFVKSFNAALEDVKKDGTYQKIKDKYVK